MKKNKFKNFEKKIFSKFLRKKFVFPKLSQIQSTIFFQVFICFKEFGLLFKTLKNWSWPTLFCLFPLCILFINPNHKNCGGKQIKWSCPTFFFNLLLNFLSKVISFYFFISWVYCHKPIFNKRLQSFVCHDYWSYHVNA